jgi:hypothetical protein
MDNAEVIANLQAIYDQLDARFKEVAGLRGDPTVPLLEIMARSIDIDSRLSSLSGRMSAIQNQIVTRQTAERMGAAVPPLGNNQRLALLAALTAVSISITTAANFSAAIQLATDISAAATSGAGAVS